MCSKLTREIQESTKMWEIKAFKDSVEKYANAIVCHTPTPFEHMINELKRAKNELEKVFQNYQLRLDISENDKAKLEELKQVAMSLLDEKEIVIKGNHGLKIVE